MADQHSIPAAAQMHQLLYGFEVSQALYVVAELGIPDELLDGPRRVESLAGSVGAEVDALDRLIRFLVPVGLFRLSDGRVEVTDLGRTLVDGPADSMRGAARYLMLTHYAPFASLIHTVRTGQVAATAYFGQPFFDVINGSPELVALQNSAMAGFTTRFRGDILDRLEFPDGDTIADIGGADGTMLAEILPRLPGRRGIVFDMPNVVGAATATLDAAGLADRAIAVGGSFFDGAPTADVYLLSAILHDWDDPNAIRILRHIADAAAPGAHLILIDTVVPQEDAPLTARISDLTMMAMIGGRERTESQWRRLLEVGGFTVQRVTSGSGMYSAIEATHQRARK
jgi:hypothetical protein